MKEGEVKRPKSVLNVGGWSDEAATKEYDDLRM